MNPQDCLILIPAFNEEKSIGKLIREVRSLGYPVLVSDDGSKDATAAKAQEAGAEVILAAVNGGKGAALRRGFDWFLNKNYPAVVMMDSDGQHDPRDLAVFLQALSENRADLLVGNRLDDPQGMPWIRRATNRFMSWILSIAAKKPVFDSQCGYRAAKREVIQKIELQTSRFEIESEILLETAKYGFTIGAVPVRCVYRDEVSRIHPVRDTLRFFNFLFHYLANRNK